MTSLLLSVWSSALLAQTEADSTDKAITLNETVVSATRWKQSMRDIPTKIIAISSRNVALQNPQTAADLLGLSGAVFIQKSQQGGGSPMIRGFATNRLIYAIDGVRMNTAIFRGGNIQNVISLDPFAIERTEVAFGPGSVIYGSDAIGGVMSFQTLTPQFSSDDDPFVTGNALVRTASANRERTGHLDVNLGWKKWAMVTSISSNDFGDLRMGSHGPKEFLRPFYVQRQDSVDIVVTNDDPKVQRPSAYSQINLMQKIRFQPNEKWDFQYGFHFSETSDYARYDRHIRNLQGLPRYGEWSYGPQKWAMHHLNVTYTDSNVLFDQVALRIARQDFGESRIDRDIQQVVRHIRREEVVANSVNLDLTKSVSATNQLYYGLELVQNQVKSTGINEDVSTGTSVPGPSRYPQSTWASYGVYVSNQWKATEKVILQTGLRYNIFALDATFNRDFYPFPFEKAELGKGALTGSLGVVYRPSGKWVLSANGATAFRAPNVDDVGKVFDSEPGAVTVPNPNLAPEYAWSGDVGIAKVFGRKLKIDLTGYYTSLQNALVRRNFQLNGQDSIDYDGTLSQVQAIQNAAIATVYGIQAGLEVKILPGLSFSNDLNFQKGREELDNGETSPSRHAPPFFGTSRLSLNAGRLNWQLSAVYSGKKSYEELPLEERAKTEIYAVDATGNPYAPGWYTLNFHTQYRMSDHFSVSGGVENITDQRYRTFSSGIAGPGRNFILSLRAHF